MSAHSATRLGSLRELRRGWSRRSPSAKAEGGDTKCPNAGSRLAGTRGTKSGKPTLAPPERTAGPPLGGRRARCRSGSRSGDARLVPGPHRKTKRARHAVATDRNFAHLFGHLPDGALPVGKYATSPGPSRWILPISSVTKTSPAMICRISSTAYCQANRPGVHDHTVTDDVPSALSVRRLERACGLPSMIQSVAHSLRNYRGLHCQSGVKSALALKGLRRAVSS